MKIINSISLSISFATLSLLIIPNHTHASHFETCDLTVTVKKHLFIPTLTIENNNISPNALILKIDKTEKKDGSYTDCKQFKGNDLTLLVEREKNKNPKRKIPARFPIGKKMKLNYNLYNGMGPNGVVTSATWKLVK
jgi:hypothetical protein